MRFYLDASVELHAALPGVDRRARDTLRVMAGHAASRDTADAFAWAQAHRDERLARWSDFPETE